MREITATIAPNSLVTVTGDAGFAGEHNAARLTVELNDELGAADVSYHCFCFDPYGLGRKIVSNNIYGLASDAPAYRAGSALVCPLPEALTATGELTVQIEAHRVADGEVKCITKSGIFTLTFEPSVIGSEESPDDCCNLLARIQAALAGAESPGAGISVCSPAEYAALAPKNPARFYLVDDAQGNDEESGGGEDEDDDEPEGPVAVTGVTLNTTALSLSAGATQTLTAAVAPANAANQAVVWHSTNTGVAAVNQSGAVTGTGSGSAAITVTTADGGFTATCTVTVTAVLPGLWQGTKTANGITVTVSGSHVTLNGTKTTADSTGGGGYLTSNLVTLFAVPAAWYTFSAGTQITIVVANQTGTAACAPANAACVLRRTDNTIIAGATWGNPAGTFTYTCTAATPVYGLLFYLQTGEVLVNYGFDVEFWVNGVRWV